VKLSPLYRATGWRGNDKRGILHCSVRTEVTFSDYHSGVVTDSALV